MKRLPHEPHSPVTTPSGPVENRSGPPHSRQGRARPPGGAPRSRDGPSRDPRRNVGLPGGTSSKENVDRQLEHRATSVVSEAERTLRTAPQLPQVGPSAGTGAPSPALSGGAEAAAPGSDPGPGPVANASGSTVQPWPQPEQEPRRTRAVLSSSGPAAPHVGQFPSIAVPLPPRRALFS